MFPSIRILSYQELSSSKTNCFYVMARVRVTPWMDANSPQEEDLRKTMARENLSPYLWSNSPGYEYPPHSHEYGKVLYVVQGSILWILPETKEKLETKAGDRLDLPSGVVHAAKVGDKGVTCLEAHSQRPISG